MPEPLLFNHIFHAHTIELAQWKDEASCALVFHDDGLPIEWTRFLHGQWSRLIKKSGVPKVRFHSLRHLYGSLLLAHDEPIAFVSKQLGHANVAITLKVYTHCLESSEVGASERLSKIFGGAGSSLVAKPVYDNPVAAPDLPISPALT